MPNLVVIYQGSNWRPAQILKPKVDGTSKVDSELRKGLEMERVLGCFTRFPNGATTTGSISQGVKEKSKQMRSKTSKVCSGVTKLGWKGFACLQPSLCQTARHTLISTCTGCFPYCCEQILQNSIRG